MFSSNAKWEAKDSSDVLGSDELLLLRDLAYRALGQDACVDLELPTQTSTSPARIRLEAYLGIHEHGWLDG